MLLVGNAARSAGILGRILVFGLPFPENKENTRIRGKGGKEKKSLPFVSRTQSDEIPLSKHQDDKRLGPERNPPPCRRGVKFREIAHFFHFEILAKAPTTVRIVMLFCFRTPAALTGRYRRPPRLAKFLFVVALVVGSRCGMAGWLVGGRIPY